MKTAIRGAVLSDLPYLYHICLRTGADGADASSFFSDPWLIGQYYAAPYLVYNSRFCFVAEENQIPRGYLVGTDDTSRFNQWFEKIWIPPLRRRYSEEATFPEKKKRRSSRELEMISHLHRPVFTPKKEECPWITEYPAHLHIDLLPELQGKGIGRTLIDTFMEQLSQAGCTGTHLGVSAKNSGAISFYKKVGFTILHEDKHGKTMGKKC